MANIMSFGSETENNNEIFFNPNWELIGSFSKHYTGNFNEQITINGKNKLFSTLLIAGAYSNTNNIQHGYLHIGSESYCTITLYSNPASGKFILNDNIFVATSYNDSVWYGRRSTTNDTLAIYNRSTNQFFISISGESIVFSSSVGSVGYSLSLFGCNSY